VSGSKKHEALQHCCDGGSHSSTPTIRLSPQISVHVKPSPANPTLQVQV
jgi:hypothetical protein